MSVDLSNAVHLSDPIIAPGDATLLGKTIAVVHPAWHSCGTHQVVASQCDAYRSLGAKVISIALMDDVTPSIGRGARWREYRSKSRDLGADRRYETSARISDLFKTTLLKDGWWPLIHGDQATWLVELAKRAPLPAGLDPDAIDLIHANHFFTVPLVEKMRGKRRIPVLLDTHDIQARQYELRNQAGFFIPPYANFDDMLAIELDWMRRADVCIHLNAEEYTTFRRLLAFARHELVYPCVASASAGANGRQLVLVASNNIANYLSIRWFLTEVAPLAPEIPLSIFGDIDEGVRSRDRFLYEKHRNLFKGRVANIQAAYADAAIVLLPTKEGHGLSIKTVEALSTGLPLVATTRAFRGMGVDATRLRNVTVADSPAEFSAAMVTAYEAGGRRASRICDTRALYEKRFASRGYAARLGEIACTLIAEGRGGAPTAKHSR